MDKNEAQRISELDREHVFYSWSVQGQVKPLLIERAEGVHLWDADGNRFLDFSSQLVNTNIGHQHPKVVKAIQDQVAVLATVAPSHANAARAEAAKRISDLAPANHKKVFFTVGGAEAVENAIRVARVKTGKNKILAAYRSYHGNTGFAINLTGEPRRWANEYAHSIVHFMGPYLYRSNFHSTTMEEEGERALQHLKDIIMYEGASTIAAVIIETVIGTAGIIPPPPGYLKAIREVCDRHGILLILDDMREAYGDAFRAPPLLRQMVAAGAGITGSIADKMIATFVGLAILRALPPALTSGVELPKSDGQQNLMLIVGGVVLGVILVLLSVFVVTPALSGS